MTISVKQVLVSCNSFKAVEKNRQIEKTESTEQMKVGQNRLICSKVNRVPSYNTIRQWVGRVGLYELQRNKEIREDRTWIIDLSLELSTEKCLVILGVSQQYLWENVWGEQRGLKHEDVEVLHIEVMKSTRGELIEDVLNKLGEKVGKPRQIISDQGSDLHNPSC